MPTSHDLFAEVPAGWSTFRFIDLFAGIGGLRLPFEARGGTCVFTCEYDRFSRQTYEANFPDDHGRDDHAYADDIRDVTADDVPEHDLLLGGFPCQPFSLAGVSKKNALGRPHGFRCDTQGTLFFDVQRIIDHHRPTAFLLENVKHLQNHDKGRTWEVIRRTRDEDLDYDVHARVIDARSFVPQSRKRIFIIGFDRRRLGGEPSGFSLDDIAVPPADDGPTLGSILHGQPGEADEERFVTGTRRKALAKYTLTEKLWDYLQGYADKHRAAGNGFGFGINGPGDVTRTLSARYYKDGSEILVRQRGTRPRRLTPRECARLMGFDSPASITDADRRWVIPVSDTQAYRQFGNAVVPPVVGAIADAMLPVLHEVRRRAAGSKTKPTRAGA